MTKQEYISCDFSLVGLRIQSLHMIIKRKIGVRNILTNKYIIKE